ncbi:HNH endonuclease [Peribacillus sp. Hz7]|uniref:HNH endonuclease n=1 Tax=Peribacillus sp. Hz7 TaxID=3344873 RepID=UPI0035CAA0D9
MNKCIYCNQEFIELSEHIFPKGLGGGNIYVDFVCNDCNNKFSNIERELIQKSFIGFIRTVEGIEGYRKNRHPAALKYLDIFYRDTDLSLLLESGIEAGLKPYFKPQIIEHGSNYLAIAANNSDGEQLQKHFQRWFKDPYIITKFPDKDNKKYDTVQFSIDENKNIHSIHQSVSKTKKHNIIYLPMTVKEYDDIFTPRVFLSADGRLYVRSKSPKQCIKFLKNLVSYLLANGSISSPASMPSSATIESPKITMHFDFNLKKCDRAAAKVLLNVLLHFYPILKNHRSIENIKDFVLGSNVFLKGGFTDKKIPYFKFTDHHQILFIVSDKDLILYISLFGTMNYSFVVEGIGNEAKKEFGVYEAISVNYTDGQIKEENPLDYVQLLQDQINNLI